MSLLCVVTDQLAPQIDCLLSMEDWELLSGIKAVTACPPVGSAAESQQHKLPKEVWHITLDVAFMTGMTAEETGVIDTGNGILRRKERCQMPSVSYGSQVWVTRRRPDAFHRLVLKNTVDLVRAQAREEARRVRERVAARKEAALRTVANLPQKPSKPPPEAPKKLNEGSSSQQASRRALQAHSRHKLAAVPSALSWQPTTNRDGQGAASTMSKLPARVPPAAEVLGSPDDVENGKTPLSFVSTRIVLGEHLRYDARSASPTGAFTASSNVVPRFPLNDDFIEVSCILGAVAEQRRRMRQTISTTHDPDYDGVTLWLLRRNLMRDRMFMRMQYVTSCAAVLAANPLARALSEMTLKQRELFGETEQDLGRGVAASSPTPARAATPKRPPSGGLSSPRLPTPASAKTSARGKARLREFYMRLLDDCGTQTSGTPLKEGVVTTATTAQDGCSGATAIVATCTGRGSTTQQPAKLGDSVVLGHMGDAPTTYTGEPACVAKNESPDSFLVHTTSLANVTHRRRRRRQSWGSPLFLASSPAVADTSSATVAASPVTTFQKVAVASSFAAGESPAAVDALRQVARVSPLSDDSEESPHWLPPPFRMRQVFRPQHGGASGGAEAGAGGAVAAPCVPAAGSTLGGLFLAGLALCAKHVSTRKRGSSHVRVSEVLPYHFASSVCHPENPGSCNVAASGTPFRAEIRGASPPWFAATRSIVQARGGTAPSPLASPGTTCIRSSPAKESPASRDSEPSEHWQGSPSSEGEDDGWVEEQWERRPRPCPPPRLLANQEVLVPRMLSTIAEMETPDLSSSTGTSSSAESGRAAACVPAPRPGQVSGGMEHLFSSVEDQLDKLQSGLRSLPKPASDSPRRQLQSEVTFEGSEIQAVGVENPQETQLVNVEPPTLIGADFSLSSVAPEKSPTKEAGPVRDPLMHQWLRDQWLRDQYSLLSFEKHEESLAQAEL
ncbi:hypothetical protein HPB47_024179 [Ixodes persulcatus]|uniref:Uncharacterized protein n=1 Tax=Ixodes persulcatus TaxID=34615 RepID=A0AC60Q7D7_IXOPE|nr:hypothetical protein HPB47_024179 [Ixodes persulcatus]